jgi:hypothetical protein
MTMLRGIGDGAFDFGQNDSGAFANFGPVILHDGTLIADPANTPATAAQCAPYQCGIDQSNAAAIFWCGFWGQEAFGGAQPCSSPACAPYKAQIPGCSIIAPTPLAPFVPTPTPDFPPPVLTPVNIVQPLPDITQPNTPVAISDTSCWCSLNEAIRDHPVLAVLALAAGTMLMMPKKGGRR